MAYVHSDTYYREQYARDQRRRYEVEGVVVAANRQGVLLSVEDKWHNWHPSVPDAQRTVPPVGARVTLTYDTWGRLFGWRL